MIWIFTYIIFNFLVFLCEGFWWPSDKHNTTITAHPQVPNATQPVELPGHDDIDPVEAEAGAIAGAVFGVLVSMGFVVFAGIMYIKRKRVRDLEFDRKTKVLKQSSQSAGVYMDTTQDNIQMRTRTTRNQGPEYQSLHKDSDLHESDSEEEL